MPKHPTKKPTRKVGASVLGAAVGTIISTSLHLPAVEFAPVTVLCTFAAGYITTEA